jgi:hypothetical protein
LLQFTQRSIHWRHRWVYYFSALGYGSELVPSLVKAQAQLNGVRIG